MPGVPDQAMQGLKGAAPIPMDEGPIDGGADQVIAQVIEILTGATDPQTKAMIAEKIMEALGGGMENGEEMAEGAGGM
jgi:hypothetical protein